MIQTLSEPLTKLLKALKEAAYLEGEFITRSGQKTNWYIDKYQFETRPEILDPLGKALANLMPPPNTYDRIAAPELGAVPLAAITSIYAKKPFVIVKKTSKEYGTKNLIEGTLHKGERVVILEDVITTGGAVLRSCEILKELGIEIKEVIAVFDRESGAVENIKKEGYTTKALFNKTQLLAN